ncbi:outer membrane lipoprotein-sorting protein [Chthoniobacter flavus]|nr:outer membrane lipoprotein-sorting protein [Chthoniobacter flavus]
MKSHIANLLAALALFAGPLLAEDAPDPHVILKTVRIAQSEQNRTLNGEIRNGGKSLPFRLVCAGSVIRYEFTNPPQVLQVKLGDKDARLEEVVDGKAAKVSPRRFDERVRDTDISYEDLSLCFLYWPNATVQGEQTMLLQKCWIIRVQPGSRGDTQYGKVDLWISKKTGALMQAEAFDAAGKLARRFKVMSGQSLGGGLWILKEMRIESFNGTSKDRNPTYLDIDKPEN